MSREATMPENSDLLAVMRGEGREGKGWGKREGVLDLDICPGDGDFL